VRRKAASRLAATDYGPNDLITLTDAIELLADRDRRKNDSDRERKGRMRERIRYAVANRELTETIRHSTKHYTYGRIAAWAQDNWPGKYDDLVAIRVPNSGGMTATHGGRYRLKGSGSQIAVTLVECQLQLQQATLRINALEQALVVAGEYAERLRPDAENWRCQCAANKLNAKRPRPR